MRTSTPALVVLAVVLLVPAAAEAVPAVDVHADPGRSPSFDLFPTHDEVVASLAEYADHPWVTVHDVGTSSEGRTIRLAEIIDPNGSVPLDDRVVTLILTQQHGNEPAGTPAALDVLDEIASGGPLADALDDQVLLLLPMANPDGAEVNQRHNAQDADINRDHIGLETPEAQALHAVLTRWDVHIAMDHHEYGGTGAGNPSPVRVYDYDLTTLYPVHGNVRAAPRQAAEALMYDGIWPAAQAAGYSTNEYGEQTAAGIPVQQLAGGPDPGIMRNHLGLHHVAGLLVETRIDAHPNPFHDAERRTDIHRVVMDATIRYAHDNAGMFIHAKAAGALDSVRAPFSTYEEGENRGPMPPALSASQNVDDLMSLHGLPNGTATQGGTVYGLGHVLQGHAAAVLHPASSRAVVDATPARVPTELAPDGEAIEATGQDVPTGALWGVLAFLVVALLGRSRRP